MAVAGATGHRILVADDSAAIALLFQQVLTAQGYEVCVVSDGEEALDQIAANPPDLILLDLNMPRRDGYEVCRCVKHNPATRLIPIIIVTAEDALDVKLRAWDLGADDFLSKPLQNVELIARCQSLLRVKRLIDDLDTAEAVVFALAQMVEAKSSFTYKHADRVKDYALALAAEVGVESDQCEILYKGALLHDIGKIGIKDDILDKPGPLTPAEFDKVKEHPDKGMRVVEPLRTLRDVLPLIRWHHERLDGRGYPDGRAGRAIPLLVRILSVADVFDALHSKRPYRDALPIPTCLEMLRDNAAGGGLDSDLVDDFCRLMDEEWAAAQGLKSRSKYTCCAGLGDSAVQLR